MASFRDLLKQTKAEIREIDTETAERLLPDATFLDVRELDEWEQGAIPGAVFIPRGHLESKVENQITDHDKPVVIYCAAGNRSAFAAQTLDQLGYHDVVSMTGGFGGSPRGRQPSGMNQIFNLSHQNGASQAS